MTRFGYAFALTLLAAAAGTACSPDPRDLAVPAAEVARAKALVRRLASPSYPDREAAAAALGRMGRLARPALAAAAAHPDPEVRGRAARLLCRAEADEFAARLDAFLADTDAKYHHDLPGWRELEAVAGDTPAAREWFVDQLADDANRRLVLAAGRPGGGDLLDLAADRRRELALFRNAYSSRYSTGGSKDPSAADVAVLLFAESHLPGGVTLPTAGGPIGARPTPAGAVGPTVAVRLKNALADEDRGPVYRAVLAHWMDTRTDPNQLADAVQLAVDVELKEGCRTAVRVLSAGVSVPVRAQALAAVGQIGGREHLPVLEVVMGLRPAAPGGKPKADDQPVVTRFRGAVTESDVQMRDLALLSALRITDQKPAEYGFEESPYRSSRQQYTSYYLPEGTRDAAFEKWKAWRAANPDRTNAGEKPGGGSR